MNARTGTGGTTQAVAVPEVMRRAPLRFLTCGSVDDGKSTLIGRLLYERRLIFDDQMAALRHASKPHADGRIEIDYALLLDGLEPEREQGITIDVSYRYFATDQRSFIVADTPGHEQYTRNMVTGASNTELAVILVDARKGLSTQTFRHAIIVWLLGIRHLVLAVNKFDLVDFDRGVFERIVSEFRNFAAPFEFKSLVPIPTSALHGDNVTSPSPKTPWFEGPTLLAHLESIDVQDERDTLPFRMVVQLVNRPHLDFRGYSGTIAGGVLHPGDQLAVAASGRLVSVKRIVTSHGDLEVARAGDAVTLELTEDVDLPRGEVLTDPAAPPQIADRLAAHVIWMGEEPMYPGRSYLMKIGARTLPITISELKYQLAVSTLEKSAAKTLAMNEIGFCHLLASSPIAFEPYTVNREMGGFILIDRYSNAVAGAGLISSSLGRATNVGWQRMTVSRGSRAQLKHQRPAILWFTGLPSAGKSTIANLVESLLLARGAHTAMLDGDNLRLGLNRDLGFTVADRIENVRRAGEVAKLMTDAGLIVLCAFISPFRAERQTVRELVPTGEFLEIFVDTPIEECIRRDPKGHFKRALAGEIQNFTGVGQTYEEPEKPELRLRGGQETPEGLANRVIEELLARNILL